MRRGMVTVVALAVVTGSCARHHDERLLGRWASVAHAKGEVATVIEFHPDGSVLSSFQTFINYKYQAGDNILMLSTVTAVPGEPAQQSFQMNLSGDRLVLTNLADNHEERLKRAAGAPAQATSVAGQWESEGPEAQPVFLDFKADGTMFLRRVITSSQGQYSIDGDSLTVTARGQVPQKGKYRLEGDQLVMTPAAGPEIRYQKLE